MRCALCETLSGTSLFYYIWKREGCVSLKPPTMFASREPPRRSCWRHGVPHFRPAAQFAGQFKPTKSTDHLPANVTVVIPHIHAGVFSFYGFFLIGSRTHPSSNVSYEFLLSLFKAWWHLCVQPGLISRITAFYPKFILVYNYYK